MIRRRVLNFILWGFFCVFVLSVYVYHITVMAQDIKEDIYDVMGQENEFIESIEDDQKISDTVLQDNIGEIAQVNEDQNTSNDQENDQDNQDGDFLSDDQTENEETMINNDDQYKIMIIFCFGVLIGVITGHALLGFIK